MKTPTAPLRVGIAGLGLMGQMHMGNLVRDPRVRVTAVATKDRDLLDGGMEKLRSNIDAFRSGDIEMGDIPILDDAEPLCDLPDLDAVYVTTPSDLHAQFAIRALRAGKHVFCEKPMALSAGDCRAMLDAARDSGFRLMIGHCLRFWPHYSVARRIVKSGEHGRVLAATFARNSGMPAWGTARNWFAEPARSGGVVVDMHVHDVDFALWLFGKPERIAAAGAYVDDSPTLVHATWHYPGGPAVLFESAWEPVPTLPFQYGFKITMEKATLVLDSRVGTNLLLARLDRCEPVELEAADCYALETKYFVDRLLDGAPFAECPAEDSLLTLETAAEELRQVAQGCGQPYPLPR